MGDTQEKRVSPWGDLEFKPKSCPNEEGSGGGSLLGESKWFQERWELEKDELGVVILYNKVTTQCAVDF